MADPICLVVCSHYRLEAEAAVAERGLEGVRVEGCPSRCGHPCLRLEEVEALRREPGEQVILFGGPCVVGLEPTAGTECCRLGNCLELLAPPRLLDHLLRTGAYLMTAGWLENWRGQLALQGPEKEIVRALWQESVTGLLLLDTGLGDPRREAAAVAEHLGLPLEVLPLGLDHLGLRLEREVLRVRADLGLKRTQEDLEQAQRSASGMAVALDFLHTLSQSLFEEGVVEKMTDLFAMLFDAARVAFVPAGEGLPEVDAGGYAVLEDGFVVSLGSAQGEAGRLLVEGLGFPERRDEYLNLALSMSGACALAIHNARAYRAELESRDFQRVALRVLDRFYGPQGEADDLAEVLGLLREFARADAVALRLEGDGQGSFGHAEGCSPAFLEACCSRCLPGPEGGRAGLPATARVTARGSVTVDDLWIGRDGCACVAEGFRSLALVPLPLGGESVGILQLNHRQPGHFTPLLVERLEGLARSIAIGLERRWAEAGLRQANAALESRVEARTAELEARVRELRCLYAVSNLLEHHEGGLGDLLQSAVSLVPSGWNDPARTFVRLTVDGQAFVSSPFLTTPWRMAAPITLRGRRRGELEVFAESGDGDSPFLEEEGNLIGTMADLVQGLVDHAEVEEEKRKVELQLLQSQKLEAIGTLAGGIAHDFNNALTPILTLADLGLMNLQASSPQRRQFEVIQKAAHRAKSLVEQILLFSRRQEGGLVPVALTPLLKEILKLIRSSLPSTIEIRQDLGPDLDPVQADPSQVHQILMNLCANAAHAMEGRGGVLAVALGRVDLGEDDPLCALGLRPGAYARLVVSDTGTGMTPEVQARIFEPFFTTKEAGKGTGMGLSVVHGIVKASGGTVQVRSAPGEGSAFTVLLPMAPVPAPEAQGPAPAVPRGSERILVVDDEEAICSSLVAMLQNLGYHAEGAPGSREGLKRFEADPAAFDLVVTDMTMPGMTGLDLAARLRALRPGLPVVLCSGFSEHLEPGDLRAAGIRAFLQKPFEAAHLAQALRRELDQGPSGAAEAR